AAADRQCAPQSLESSMSSVIRHATVRVFLCAVCPVAIALALLNFAGAPLRLETPLHAAASAGCEGGAFSIVLGNGQVISGDTLTTIPAASVGDGFAVKGKYVEFNVTAASFEVRQYALPAAPHALCMPAGGPRR